MLKRPIGIIFLVYLIIGVIVAWEKGYLHLSLLKAVGSAILAILLWWLPLQRFGYRQIMYYVVVRSLWTALRGPFVGWGKLERHGTVRARA